MKKIITALAIFASTIAFSQVGIGTQNPQQFLHIDGGKDNPTTGAPNATQATNDFVVTSTGRVGIGTPNPSTKLHIDSSNSPAFRLTDGTQQAARVLTSDGSGNGTWQALSSGNKTAEIEFTGNQTFSTSSATTFSATPTIISNEISCTATNTNINLSAGKYLIVINSDLAAGEYGIYRVLKGSNNQIVYQSVYGEWFNGSFLLDISSADDSIYFQFQGFLSNPSTGYFRNNYTNVGWSKKVIVLKLN